MLTPHEYPTETIVVVKIITKKYEWKVYLYTSKYANNWNCVVLVLMYEVNFTHETKSKE